MNPIIEKYYLILFGKNYPPLTEAEVLAEIYDRNPLAFNQITNSCAWSWSLSLSFSKPFCNISKAVLVFCPANFNNKPCDVSLLSINIFDTSLVFFAVFTKAWIFLEVKILQIN